MSAQRYGRINPKVLALAASCIALILTGVPALATSVNSQVFIDRFELDLEGVIEMVPGTFVHASDDILIGAHPQAIEEPVPVRLRTLPPPDDLFADLPVDERSETEPRPVGQMLELIATDQREPYSMLPGRGRAAFIVAIPVPDGFDVERLVPKMLAWGQYSMQHDIDPPDFPDIWMPINGVYDPEYGLYLVDVPTIGGWNFPTYLTLIEHPWETTESIQPILDWLIDDFFPNALQAGPEARLPTWKTGPNWSKERSDPESFELKCRLVHGFPSMCTDSSTATGIVDLFNGMGPHLESSLEDFQTMVGTPSPRLKTNSQDQYVYFLRSEATRSKCADVNGFYNGFTKNAMTCTRALGSDLSNVTRALATTRHELFHTIQFSYASAYRQWVTEATAALTQSGGLLINRDERPVDIGLKKTGDGLPYQAEQFWLDLLYRSELADLRGVSRIFREGLNNSAARDFVESRTPFDSLGEAHWHWANNALFVGDIQLPSAVGDDLYTHRCEPNNGALANGMVQMPLQGDSSTEIEIELDPLSATLVEIQLPPRDEHHYYLLSYEKDSFFGAGPMIRAFHEEFKPLEDGGCSQTSALFMFAINQPGAANPDIDEGSAATVSAALSPPADESGRTAYLLISNPGETFSATYMLRASAAQTDDDLTPYPPVEEWYPTAPDLARTMDSSSLLLIEPLAESDPGYGGESLVIIDPAAGGVQTAAGNHVYLEAASAFSPERLRFEVEDPQFDGTDSFEYTIRNDHGYTDTATVTITRSVIPTAKDLVVRTGLTSVIEIDPRVAVDNPAGGSIRLLSFNALEPFRGSAGWTSAGQTTRDIRYTADGLAADVALYGYVDQIKYEIENDVGLRDTGTITIEVNRPNWELAVDNEPFVPPDLTACKLMFGAELGSDLFARVDQLTDGRLGSAIHSEGKDMEVPGLVEGDRNLTVLKDVEPNGNAAGWSFAEKGVRPVLWSAERGELIDIAGDLSPDIQGRIFGLTDSGLMVGQQLDPELSHVLLVQGQKRWLLDQEELKGHSLALGAGPGEWVFGVTGLRDDSLDRLDMLPLLDPPGGGNPGCGPAFPTDSGLFSGGGSAFAYHITDTQLPERGNLHMLPSLGGDLTVPRAVNDSGVVVGAAAVEPLPDHARKVEKILRAFLWDEVNGMVELPTLGGRYGEAFAVSAEGVVAGMSADENGDLAGFVWEQGLMVNLNDLLPKDSRWYIVSATEVSDKGLVKAWAVDLENEGSSLRPVVFRLEGDELHK